ncbi:ribonuclease H-like domain-containing protein [Tanacetum coccineum]
MEFWLRLPHIEMDDLLRGFGRRYRKCLRRDWIEYCLTSLSGWIKIWCAPVEALYGRKCRSPVLWVEIEEISLTGLELVQETNDKALAIRVRGGRSCVVKGVAIEGRNAFWKEGLHVPLDEIKVDKTLCFVEEPVENSNREVKRFLTSLLDDRRGLGSWMFLFVWSGYVAMRTLCGQAKLLTVAHILDDLLLYLGDNLLSWYSKRQHTISWSSVEVEYKGDVNVVPSRQWTKYSEINIHFNRDMVTRGRGRVLHVPSCYQYADIFTQGLPSALFEEFHTSLSVWISPA